MKKLLIFLILTLGLNVNATHLAGGDIQYRYIGDSTGVARHYKVILRVYRDITGIAMPATQPVTISSSCYSNITLNLNLTAGSGVVSPTLFDCVNASSSTKTLEIYRYIGYVTLPGNCSDYVFWYSNCCRPGGIDNINGSNGTGSDGFYFDALLDNATDGQNSSPIFVSEPVRAFCVGNPFNWKQSTVEADGDSIVYSLINCREGNYPNQTDIPFDAGWTAQQPVNSTYFNINPNTGLISFYPTTQEIDVLSVLVEEYRYDSVYGYWFQVGSASRDMMISVSSLCNPTAMSGVQYDTTLYSQDTVTPYPAIYAKCGDTSLTLKFHIALDCYSVNIQDFRMTSPISQPHPIASIEANCNVNEETDSLVLGLLNPLQEGRYYLYSKKGMDGNTLINKCGIPMTEFDTIMVLVGKCPPPPPPSDLPTPILPTGNPLPIPVPSDVIIPNLITPNGDGLNDLFIVTNLMDWEQRSLIILNRWGNTVYQSNNYLNNWDGGNLADGVYFYVLEVRDKDLYDISYGTVTIMGNN